MQGRHINRSEQVLIENMTKYFQLFMPLLKRDKLIEKEFSLSEEVDESGLGVEMQWMTVFEQLEEITIIYPGKTLIGYSYFPIGKCLEGSGDQYYIKLDEYDDLNGYNELKIYRIPHDIKENEFEEDEIEYICLLKDLLR